MRSKAATAYPEDMLSRIRGEYDEMPGLNLRRDQARRLWHLDDATCGELLDALVENQFLHLRSDGRYVRVGSGRD
jgi:hypothetical protein